MSTEFRKVKIKIETPQQSIAVQEFLFTQGCRWNRSVTVGNTGAKYLFVEESGSIGWDNSDDFFEARTPQFKEMEFTFENKIVVKSHKLKEREKTVLFGKTYYTDELNARLEGLKAC